MKKQYLFILCTALIGNSFGQTFSDNFDTYAVGDNLAAKSAVWETWSGPNGGADDVKITNAKANTATAAQRMGVNKRATATKLD